jgi:transcriptional regulator with XRE-family HTH domain
VATILGFKKAGMNHNSAFGIALKEQRLQLKKTQETLGFDTDLARNFISLLEKGQRSPTLDTINALCSALQLKPSELLRRAEEIQAEEDE